MNYCIPDHIEQNRSRSLRLVCSTDSYKFQPRTNIPKEGNFLAELNVLDVFNTDQNKYMRLLLCTFFGLVDSWDVIVALICNALDRGWFTIVSKGPIHALYIGSDPSDAELNALLLDMRDAKIQFVAATCMDDAKSHLQTSPFDIVLIDLGACPVSGFETFLKLRDMCKDVPIVVISALNDEANAIKTVQHGAQDYLVKSQIDAPLLSRTILYAVERYRLMKKIELQARQLERDKSQARFIEIIAHELRNPMSVAKAILTLLRVQVKNNSIPPDLLERLQTVENEIDRLSSLLNAVFEAFRTQEGEFDFVWETCDLQTIIHEALIPFRACQGKHRFLVNEARESVFVSGDRRHLEQVLRSLFENAMKYSPDGGRIWIDYGQRDTCGWITVEDEGLGIPEDELEHVFEGFYRAGNAVSHDLAGLGLGLFIGKAIIEAHDGRIWAENKPGGGARFSVEIPLAYPITKNGNLPQHAKNGLKLS